MGREAHRRMGALALVAVASFAGATLVPTASVPHAEIASAAVASAVAQPVAARPSRCPFPTALRPAFVQASRDTNLPGALLYAVAKVESNLRQEVTSEAGARGVLQLMPATAAMLALDANEPRTNVLAGARYLRQMLDRFTSTDLALAAYNAGPTAVEQSGGAPTTAVVSYVAKVTALWRSYAGCS